MQSITTTIIEHGSMVRAKASVCQHALCGSMEIKVSRQVGAIIDAHKAALAALLIKLEWQDYGTWIAGGHEDGHSYVWILADDQAPRVHLALVS